MKQTITKRVRAAAAALATPAGFTREEFEDKWLNAPSGNDWSTSDVPGILAVRLTSERECYIFRFVEERDGRKRPIVASGSTWFEAGGKWFTYDRHGISDSFYVGRYGAADANEIIPHEQKRIAESRARLAVAVDVPGLPIPARLAPGERERIAARLKAGGHHDFTPGGMGTGYRVSGRPSRWATAAPKALAEFFGIAHLYIDTFDHD